MKKNKLNIKALAVKSFVTEFDAEVSNTLKAGSPVSQPNTGYYCGTEGPGCQPPTGHSNNQPK